MQDSEVVHVPKPSALEVQAINESSGKASIMRISSETVLSTLSPLVDKQARKISLPEPVSLATPSTDTEDSTIQTVQTINEKVYQLNEDYNGMGGTPVSGGTPISGDSPAQHLTPENTMLPGQDNLHIKLTQQSSLDKQLNPQMQTDAG